MENKIKRVLEILNSKKAKAIEEMNNSFDDNKFKCHYEDGKSDAFLECIMLVEKYLCE